jgi:hypothetical protein
MFFNVFARNNDCFCWFLESYRWVVYIPPWRCFVFTVSIASRRVTTFVSLSEPFKPCAEATKYPIDLKNPSNPFHPLRANPSAISLSWLHQMCSSFFGFSISSQSFSGDPALFTHSVRSSENTIWPMDAQVLPVQFSSVLIPVFLE